VDIVGSKITEVIAELKSTKSNKTIPEMNAIFDIAAYLDVNNNKFNSWKSYFGPDPQGTYNFTNLGRWDFNNKDVSLKIGGLIVSGFLDHADLPPQVFQPQNMVFLTDAGCASTCTIFANLLKLSGVKSIVIGGRPRNGPVQAVGAVKGAQVMNYRTIFRTAASIFENYATPQEAQHWQTTDLGALYRTGEYVMGRTLENGNNARINYRNSIAVDDQSRTPRQFVFEPADCRIWLTKDMLFDMNSVWAKAATTAWSKDVFTGCTLGSTP
jgi:hypothetical protein